MKKLVLYLVAFLFAGSVFAQQELTLTIIETHVDGDVSISFDDGEYENDSIDKLDDDDLDMGWEGDDLNIMTAFTRFQNVTIPQGETIQSAILKIYAHEDEEDEAIITVFGEAADDSEAFAEDEALDDREYTTATVDWTCSDSWTMWDPYESPDLAAIIQEIVDRPGWESGNALTLFMQGTDQGASELDNARDFESYENIEDPDDGGDGLHHPERIPTLVISYGEPSAVNDLNEKTYCLYPNPANSDFINLDFSSEDLSEIMIFDITGKNVLNASTLQNAISLDVSNLNRGVYLVKIVRDQTAYTEKLILE